MGIEIKFWEKFLDDLKNRNPILAEIVKQAVDQILHILMTVGSVLIIGTPLVKFTDLPVWASALIAGLVTAIWVGVREFFQWPSKRIWDPILDWVFEASGIALGLWILISHIS